MKNKGANIIHYIQIQIKNKIRSLQYVLEQENCSRHDKIERAEKEKENERGGGGMWEDALINNTTVHYYISWQIIHTYYIE